MITPRKWGVELECYGPIDRDTLQDHLRAAGLRATATTYTHDYAADWRITTDASIRDCGPGQAGTELVSPPSFDSEDLERVCRRLQELRFTTNHSCGMHTHVDAEDIENFQTIKQLVKLWMRYEPVFAALVTKSRLTNKYCKLLRNTLGYSSAPPFNMVDSAHCGECLSKLIQQRDRYSALNLESWWRHGTVEFRLHHGTVDGPTATTWVELMVALVELATCNIQVPAVTGTAEGFIADLNQHLAPQGKVIGLANKLRELGEVSGARTTAAFAGLLMPMSPQEMVDWTQQKLGSMFLPVTDLATAAKQGLFPSKPAIQRVKNAIALPAEATWA